MPSTSGSSSTGRSAISSQVTPLHNHVLNQARPECQQVVVHNTFIHVLEPASDGLKRSSSDSALSSSVRSLSSYSVSTGSARDVPELEADVPDFEAGAPYNYGVSLSNESETDSDSAIPILNVSIEQMRSSGQYSNKVIDMHVESGAPLATLQGLESRRIDLDAIPRHPRTGKLLSVGSMRHVELEQAHGCGNKPEASECSPCLFWFRNSCDKGVACLYCHFRHRNQRVKRVRPSKKTRERLKKQKEPGDEQGVSEEEDDSFQDGAPDTNNFIGRTSGAAPLGQVPSRAASSGYMNTRLRL